MLTLRVRSSLQQERRHVTLSFDGMAISLYTISHAMQPLRPLRTLSSLLNDSRYFWTLAFLVIVGDACLTQLIVQVIPCEMQVCYSEGKIHPS